MESLKKNREFKQIYSRRRSVANHLLVLYVQDNGLQKNRLGVSISRKVGCAVVRNRIKRQIKEYLRIHKEYILTGYDLVVVVRTASAKAGFDQIGRSLYSLLVRHNMVK